MTTTQRLLGATTALMIAAGTNAQSAPSPTAAVTIVLVHGALIDGSSWRGVYDVLIRDGYRVSIVQQPLTGLDEDVAATKRVLDQQDGPVIRVGHSPRRRPGDRDSRARRQISGLDSSSQKIVVEREVRFRDVVHYLIFDEYTRAGKARAGTKTNMGEVVARIIREEI